MRLLATIRSLGRAALGLRPHQSDLDRIVRDMRRQLLRGKPIRPFKPSRVPSAMALRQLRALQLRKLKKTVAYVHRYVPYYRRALDAAGIRPQDIRSLDDLRRLPITHRTDMQSFRNDFISRAPGLTPSVRLYTSGTTGKPLEVFLTHSEFDYYTSMQAIGGMTFGFLGPSHIIQVHLPLDASIASQILTAAAHKSGALVLNYGLSGTLDKHLESLFEERNIPGKSARVSGLFAAPGYLWALTARAEQLGLDCSKSGLRQVFTCGAMVSDALKQRFQATWGIRLLEGYSMVEAPATTAIECEHGRLHFLDFSGIIEFLDPKTQTPVPPGEPGIAVVTSFYPDRELTPVLRYWTQDLMRPSANPFCPCGLVTTPIDDILGRVDHMIIVGAANVYPHPVGDVLTTFRELIQPPRFQIRVEERSEAQYIVLDVECEAALDEPDKGRLAGKIRSLIPGSSAPHMVSGIVKCEVNLVPSGTIQTPFPYKLQGPTPR